MQLKVGEKKDEKPKTPSSAVRRARRSATAEGYRRSPMNAVYQDINSQAYSSPSSPWRDNILSGGLGSQVRSPLSVLGRNQINRAGLPHHGDIAKKTYAGGSLTSTKEAVAELMAMERWLNKENVVARVGQTLPTVDTRATVMLKSIHVDASVENSDVDSQAETKVPKYSARVAVERDVAELFDRSVDSGNKENVRIGLDVARRTEKEAGDMIIESLSQLDKRARTLRRRSQLTNDVDERARLMRQLEIIQQRRRELDSLQQEIGAKLGMYVSEDDPSAGKENVAEVAGKCDEPLNLKVVSSTATSENATDADEPLNLKVCGSRGTTDDVACCGSGRVILGDITARIVGEITDDDYIEVPDSPVPADGISEENVKDAEQMLLDDGLHQNDSKPAADDDVPLDLCVVKRSDAASSSESAAAATATPVKGLQHYLASLNLSVISDAAGSPPRSDACGNTSVTSSSGSPAVTRSPDMSSEFVGYQTYCPLLTDEDSDVRCGDPVAMMLLDGDEQVRTCL
jgi:hypothetical protein